MDNTGKAAAAAPVSLISEKYRGRFGQIRIFLGKFLRMFVYQNDWKVLPMAALVAGMVSLVIRGGMFRNMEGTLEGAFAVACVAIWNGCFNSIQSICRERGIIKREHRSGMHISSYIAAHMLYQALLCLTQTVITVYIFRMMGVQFPDKAMFTSSMEFDFGITLFHITYAADMMALWISSVARSTTTAMTVMPFILIVQLVFSGGIFALPQWADPITDFTVSNYGLNCIAAQSDYNALPLSSGWSTLRRLRNEEIVITPTVGQIMDFMADESNGSVKELRDMDTGSGMKVGTMIDLAAMSPDIQENRDREIEIRTTVGQLIEAVGEDELRAAVETKSAEASRRTEYERTKANISSYWWRFIVFSFMFALFAMITLEFIDKDKR